MVWGKAFKHSTVQKSNAKFCEDIDLGELTLQETEVKAVKWAGREEIKKMIDDGSFIPYFKSLIDFMFESVNGRGAHVNEPDRFVK